MVTRLDPDQTRVSPFNDAKGSGSTLESGAVHLADEIDSIVSMLKNIIGESKWYDAPDKTIATLAAQATLEAKLILKRKQIITDIAVPATQNFVALGSGEYPSEVKAIGGTVKGAVTAQLAGAIGSHSLTEIAGFNPLNPKNLLAVVDAVSGDPIMSSARRVWGLLQVGSAATDGTAFAASGNEQPQISFVRADSAYADLEACPVADIESKSIIYSYVFRDDLQSMPEQAFLPETLFADPGAGAVGLNDAYDAGSVIDVDDTNVDWRLTDDKEFIVSDATGAAKILRVRALAAGDLIEMNLPGGLDLNGNLDGGTYLAEFNGVRVGGVAGQVDRTGATLTLKSITSGDVALDSVANVTFKTVRETSALPLDDATAGKISALAGGPHASISAAIKYALEHGGVDLTIGVTVLASNYGQDVNVPGGAGSLDISSPHSIDMNTPSGVDTLIFLNGRLLYGGNGTTNNDVYAGTTPASGDIKFDFPGGVKTGDVIIAIRLAQ